MKYPVLLMSLLALAGCSVTEEKVTIAPDPQKVDASRAAAKMLGGQLGGVLQKEMSTNGPAAAVDVCKVQAPKITAEVSAKTGLDVSRVGTRVRNPGNAPDAWEAAALKQFAERMAQGEKPDTLEFAQVVQTGNTKTLRYAKAIALQPVCVTCHGAAESIPDGVKARIAVEYPVDKAVDYQPGQLRGAFIVDTRL
jgi:hypothetical protein